MGFARIQAAQPLLLEARPIQVEIDTTKGLYNFNVVGLPAKAVEEARERVTAALRNCGYRSPTARNLRVTVSLTPATLKKDAVLDLPIAIGYLISSGEEVLSLESTLLLGELSLDGSLLPVRGVLPVARYAKEAGFHSIILPKGNEQEALYFKEIEVFPAQNLKEVVSHLKGEKLLQKALRKNAPSTRKVTVDFEEIHGQEFAKRAVTIAAAGGHNLGLYGPPGTGKTMLARALQGIMPPLTEEEWFEVTSIHSSVTGATDIITEPPFRSPHHTSTYASIVGGAGLLPGEATLAHKGVLFLDEFPEYDRRVIESLREPLEEGKLQISRAKGSVILPAEFILVVALNPCPCGNFGTDDTCRCSAIQVERYRRKLSGPIIDRIDLWVEVPRIKSKELYKEASSESSSILAEGVARARAAMQARGGTLNRNLRNKNLSHSVQMTKKAEELLLNAGESIKLSPRSHHRVTRVARTIADLEGSEAVEETHVLEALQYRPRFNDDF